MGLRDKPGGTRIGFGEFVLDCEKQGVYVGAERMLLTPMPLRVLIFLIENHGRVVSKDELLQEVWRAKRGKDTVEHAITSIRHALRDDKDHPRFIETVQGHGYSFIGEITTSEAGDFGAAPFRADEMPSVESSERTQRPTEPLASLPVTDLGVAAEPEAMGNGAPGEGAAQISRRWLLLTGGVIVTGGALGLLAFTAARRRRGPESLSLDGQTLTAQDGRGTPLWEYHFKRPLLAIAESDRSRRFRLVPWSKDGRSHVVYAASHHLDAGSPIGEEVLYCFSPDGHLAWSLPLRPELKDAYGAAFEPGWIVSDLLVTGGGVRPARLWVSVVHYFRFASGVIQIGAEGKPALRFANAGHVQRLCGISVGNDNLIAAGGVNNAVDRTCLAVFGEEDPPAMSPDLGVAHYHYQNEPGGSVRAYALLPASEYNLLAEAPYSHVAVVFFGNGSLFLTTLQGGLGARENYRFEFTADLGPLKVFESGTAPFSHRQLEA